MGFAENGLIGRKETTFFKRGFSFIPDGDVKKELKANENILFLPGESRPETLIYNNLKDTEDSDTFWKKCNSESNSYNRQVAIIKEGTPPKPSTSKEAKNWYKNWYKKQSPFWGRMNNIAYKKWAIDNKDDCKDFCRKFFKVLKKVSSEQIPKSLFAKILKKYE